MLYDSVVGMWVAIFGKLQNGATRLHGVNPENHNVGFHDSEDLTQRKK